MSDGVTPNPAPTSDGADTLGAEVRSGLGWSFLNQFVARGASVLSGIVMARILAPRDFGVFAVALTVVNVLMALNDLGVILGLVRWKGDLREAARTAFTLALGSSLLLYAFCYVTAPWFAAVMNSPESAGVLRLLGLAVIIDGATATSNGLLVRAFRQNRLAQAEFCAMPVGIGVSVGLALSGAGAWSLAGGQLAGNLASAVFVLAAAPFRVRPGLDPRVARWMLGFGLPLAGTTLVEWALLSVDYVIVGRALGPVALGFYMLAFNVSNWPVSIMTAAIRRVSIAGFARLADDEESLRRGFDKAFRLLVTVTVPIVLGLSVLAVPVVGFLYGDRWLPSADVLHFLAVLGGVRVMTSLVFDVLIGLGRSRTTLWLQSAWLVVLVPLLEIGARVDDIAGVGLAHAGIALFVAAPLFLVALRGVGVDVLGLVKGLWRPALGGLVAAGVATATTRLVDGHLVTLLVAGPLLLLSYALVAVPLDTARDALAALRRRRLASSPAAGEPARQP